VSPLKNEVRPNQGVTSSAARRRVVAKEFVMADDYENDNVTALLSAAVAGSVTGGWPL